LETAAKLAHAGNRILSFFAAVLILTLLLYGGYSLWDTAMVYQGAFVSWDLLQYKPSLEKENNTLTLAELQRLNADTRGWITVDQTHIDYPVVQGKTNMDYINKDVQGDFALSGSVFEDCRNSADFSDEYCLLYGHHMDNGAMFGDVMEFLNADYFAGHPSGILYLSGKTFQITFFACVEADAMDSVIYNPKALPVGNIEPVLNRIRETAVQTREIGITAQDHIIGLSTCAEAETNGRVILFGRLEEVR